LQISEDPRRPPENRQSTAAGVATHLLRTAGLERSEVITAGSSIQATSWGRSGS